MSAGHEIGRKFLVTGDLPLDLDTHPHEHINQGYVAVDENGTEVRLRTKGNARLLTVKSAPARTRVEEEIEIDERCFESLWALTAGRQLEQTVHERLQIRTMDLAEPPERFRTAPLSAPASHASAASSSVTVGVALRVPRRVATCASARQALASASDENVLPSVRSSRAL